MRPFTFRREARWLMWVTVVPPLLAILLSILLPALRDWLAGP